MDIEEIERKSYTEHMKAFENWRQELIDKYSILCIINSKYLFLNTRVGGRTPSQDVIKDAKELPNILVKFTRQMCKCFEECTQESLLKFNFIPCPIFRTSADYKEDDKFYDSLIIDKKVVDGVLIDGDIAINEEYYRVDIKSLMQDLCDDKKGSLRKLKCKTYEVKDYCGYDRDCFERVTYDVLPQNFRNCQKVDFSSDLNNIGIKLGDPLILKNVRVSRDLQHIDDFVVSSASNYNFGSLLIFIPIALLGIYLSSTVLNTKISKVKFSFLAIIFLAVFYLINFSVY